MAWHGDGDYYIFGIGCLKRHGVCRDAANLSTVTNLAATT
ncbi:uncharacterized protein G2W53_036476 [Senna tora]|uniref:Uncharacterized protein n=1 Tax=Senna tora TaxID=362788 RepID=A0A834W631_9FABA|nr:uncharacterized protein G2W53_036476 [Senna tora]